MYYPLLENLDNFIRENGIATKEVYISTKRLPHTLIEAAAKELSKNGRDYSIDDTCVLSYDNGGHICLVLTFNNMKTNLLITDAIDNLRFPNPNFKFTKVRSSNIFRKAQRIEWIDRKVYASYHELYNKYVKAYEDYANEATTEKERITRETRLLKKKREFRNLLKDQIEFLFESNSITADYGSSTTFNQELKKFENTAIQYISYLNNEYKESKKKNVSSVVYFTPEENIPSERRSGAPSSIYIGEHERKNAVLAANYRDQIVESLNPIMTKVAISDTQVGTINDTKLSNGDDLDSMYTCSILLIGQDEYKLVMEPFNGTRYTKVAYFTYHGVLDNDIIDDIIKKYISMNNKHILESNSIIRIGHTTDEAYTNSLLYAITKNKELNCRKYFIDKVDNLIPEEIEKVKTL